MDPGFGIFCNNELRCCHVSTRRVSAPHFSKFRVNGCGACTATTSNSIITARRDVRTGGMAGSGLGCTTALRLACGLAHRFNLATSTAVTAHFPHVDRCTKANPARRRCGQMAVPLVHNNVFCGGS